VPTSLRCEAQLEEPPLYFHAAAGGLRRCRTPRAGEKALALRALAAVEHSARAWRQSVSANATSWVIPAGTGL
jgi:hypothetical protein